MQLELRWNKLGRCLISSKWFKPLPKLLSLVLGCWLLLTRGVQTDCGGGIPSHPFSTQGGLFEETWSFTVLVLTTPFLELQRNFNPQKGHSDPCFLALGGMHGCECVCCSYRSRVKGQPWGSALSRRSGPLHHTCFYRECLALHGCIGYHLWSPTYPPPQICVYKVSRGSSCWMSEALYY